MRIVSQSSETLSYGFGVYAGHIYQVTLKMHLRSPTVAATTGNSYCYTECVC